MLLLFIQKKKGYEGQSCTISYFASFCSKHLCHADGQWRPPLGTSTGIRIYKLGIIT